MRRLLIRFLLPLLISVFPLLVAGLVALAIPLDAQEFYLQHLSYIDWLILGLGASLFTLQMIFCWQALQCRRHGFNEEPDRWLSNLAQAAEWFPLLGLLGTVAGILQTFSSIDGPVEPARVISLYAPAITATGSGLFMALINILPTWLVLLGRELLLPLGGGEGRPSGELPP